jgi:flagellar assembly protein FliH
MSKAVFKTVEVASLARSVRIEKPETIVVNRVDDEQEKIKQLLSEQQEIQTDNKNLIKKTQEEAERMLTQAKADAERIIKDAEEEAFRHIQLAVEKAKVKEAEILAQREKEIRQKEEEARLLIERANREAEDIRDAARKQGLKQGYQEGFDEGKAEAVRLAERLKVILEAAIDKREEIISSAEEQIVRIILLIGRKVVKHITEKDEQVVIANIKSALQKIQGKEQVIIKVNSKDLEITTEHKEEFIALIEGLKNVKILEDSRVDRGGCIIETDFGSIDGRIFTQLEEIEDRIREMAQMTMFDPVANVEDHANANGNGNGNGRKARRKKEIENPSESAK